MKTAIVTDSNSGITQMEAQKMNVFVLPMPVIIEGQAYYEGIDLLPDQFFRALTERQAVSTSQPSPGDVTALWDKVLAEYEELVYIPMSSGLSASCATAQMLAEDYEGRVFVVDNHRISISQKSSAWDAVALREAGCGAQEIQRELEVSGLDSIVYVGVETLEYLRRGGRVTAGAAAIGAVLQIKPLLKIEGELLDACAKVRGTAGCKKKLLETIRGDAERLSAKWDIDIAVAGSYQDAAALEDWREMAVNAFPEHGGIFADPLSFSVSSHVGPDAFGMAVSRRLARTKDGILSLKKYSNEGAPRRLGWAPFLLTSRHLRNRAALMNGGKTLQGHLNLLLAVELCCITCRLHCTAEKKAAICAFHTAPALQTTCATGEKVILHCVAAFL